MHTQDISAWRHDHVFDQDCVRSGERRTLIVVLLTLVTMFIEIFAGMVYGSMALLADGLHMGSHATALGIAAFAYAYARRHAGDHRFSFGTGKINALGGFTGAVLLVGFAVFMGIESINRFFNPVAIVFDKAILVAGVGLVVNGISAWILGAHGHDHEAGHGGQNHHHEHDHNRRSAYFHVLADALTSLLAIFALLAAKYLGLQWMDPVMGIVGAILITRWSWGLLRDTSQVLLDRQVHELDEKIRDVIEIGSSDRISDLHVWSIGPGIYAGIIAIVSDAPATPHDYRDRVRQRLPQLVHVTFEVEQCAGHRHPQAA
ncbi:MULTISPECIES: CDF family Co(II)/Ni(II) efflux transporter DmeF [Chromohalobacter]|uniref:CDF family Co(II)/Ni(II) efflux transporter DmeF n=1 Tax=Chromohalobacter TaxID=42054 RepID=UPI001FF535A1|nr:MULTISPECIES: CDF family Co(II)/Ni(II) efflux transporter DmeF [Chromohalobacter]MCK0754245.1 CDF family Co(II)/Ni(II) efflux transporter DmeF [Chromohalobacter japonicus]MCK2041904.1 CDF family Co(II)/Ni(II) efflux transporter DmeF [Chromohalobacter moromii]MCT8514052.1 CDF family Co(II)/Ni(II) efflux transporter DmeF [Chromohalobacter sp. TMW 2.2271]